MKSFRRAELPEDRVGTLLRQIVSTEDAITLMTKELELLEKNVSIARQASRESKRLLSEFLDRRSNIGPLS